MDNYENIVEKIAKDIRDKQDKEMAVAFTNSIDKNDFMKIIKKMYEV